MTDRERAADYFMQGYNCSQSVFLTFYHRFGIDQEAAKKISAGLGGGLGRMRETCGAVSAAAMVLGSLTAATEGRDRLRKAENYELVREFARRFAEIHGTIICRERLKLSFKMEDTAMPDERTAEYYKKRPCIKVVCDAAEILSNMIEEYESKNS